MSSAPNDAEGSAGRAKPLVLFSHWQVVVGTLLGGTLLGCAFVALNYHRIQSPKNARVFWSLAVIGLPLALLAPWWLPLAVLGAVLLGLFSHTMQSRIVRFYDGNVEFESWWVVVGWCGVLLVLGILVTLVGLTILRFLA